MSKAKKQMWVTREMDYVEIWRGAKPYIEDNTGWWRQNKTRMPVSYISELATFKLLVGWTPQDGRCVEVEATRNGLRRVTQ